MRKEIIYSLLLLFKTVVVICQNNVEAQFIYNVRLKQHDKKVSLKPEQKQYNIIAEKSGKKTLILDIKNHESTFYLKKKLKSDSNSKIDLLSAFIGNNRYYYNSSNKSFLIEKNFLGENFIIITKPNLNWKLTQEQKIIGKYTCYQAIATKEVTNRIGKKIKKEILAWYTLDIPIRVGIKDYQDLPGVIVLLEAEGLKYELSEIKTKLDTSITIIKPSKGKIVTQEEFDKILLKNYRIR